MVGEVAGFSVCLVFWGTKAYLASQIPDQVPDREGESLGLEARNARLGHTHYAMAAIPGLAGVAWFHLLLVAPSGTRGGSYT